MDQRPSSSPTESPRRSDGALRVFHIGTFLQDHVSDHLRSKGLRQAGCEVIDYDYRSRAKKIGGGSMGVEVLGKVGSWKPHIVLINKGELLAPEIVRAIKQSTPEMFVALFFGDQRGMAVRDIARLGAACDMLLVSNADPVQFECYRRLGVPRVMAWHTASDPGIYRPVKPDPAFECDVAFMGGNYSHFPDSAKRAKLINLVAQSDMKVRVYGSNWGGAVRCFGKVYEKDFAIAVASAKVVLGINAYNDIHQYTSNRTWNVLSCGTAVYATYAFAGMGDLFKSGKHLVSFRKVEQAVGMLQEIIDPRHDKDRARIAKAGRELVLGGHTYRHRAEQLLEARAAWLEEVGKALRLGRTGLELVEGSTKNLV